MRKFDYSFLKDTALPASLVGTAVGIGKLAERINSRISDNPAVFSELQDNARLLSVRASNAIEGIRTSDERLRSIMDHGTEPLGHDEQEIAGYRDALALIHKNYNSMDISESTILGLHRIVMSYTAEGGGKYKDSDNVIAGTDAFGNMRVIFRPTSANDTPSEMEQMLLAYAYAEQNRVEPLLLIPCFILDFLSIHPFMDGNGRVSRLLTLLLLYKHGYDVGKYVSFEEKIDDSRGRYYRCLSESSDNWHENENDYVPFLRYTLEILSACYISLDRCFATVEGKKATKNNRIEAVVMNSIVPISKKEILSALPDVSQRTVEVCLHNMLKEGSIEKLGGNRNARYRKKTQ